MNKNNPKKVRVLWQDAISHRTGDKIPLSISNFETIGLLVNENDNCVLIKKPVTINTKTGKNYPDKQPNFFLIPKVLILEKHFSD